MEERVWTNKGSTFNVRRSKAEEWPCLLVIMIMLGIE